MPDITATEAARNFADMLDAVEHKGERYRIVRRGKAVAKLEPITQGNGRDLKEILERIAPDKSWINDLAEVRGSLVIDQRQ